MLQSIQKNFRWAATFFKEALSKGETNSKIMSPELQELLMPIAVMVPFAALVVLFTRALTDYFLKKRIVQSGLSSEEMKELLKKQQQSKYSSLKWGLIILFGGLGLLVISAVPYQQDSPFPFGILAVSVSLGFLIYYFMVKKEDSAE